MPACHQREECFQHHNLKGYARTVGNIYDFFTDDDAFTYPVQDQKVLLQLLCKQIVDSRLETTPF